jgi:hypothetical protein
MMRRNENRPARLILGEPAVATVGRLALGHTGPDRQGRLSDETEEALSGPGSIPAAFPRESLREARAEGPGVCRDRAS